MTDARHLLTALFALLCLSLWSISPASVWAAEYTLFSRAGIQVPDYDKVIASLKTDFQPGDVIVVGRGVKFTLTEILGEGNTTLVFAIGNGKAIRIPAGSGLFHSGDTPGPGVANPRMLYTDYITHFLEGYALLRDNHVPAVKVFEKKSVAEEYVIVEKLNVKFSLQRYLFARTRTMSAEEVARLDTELTSFIRKCSAFVRFGDLRPEQVLYTDKGWVLADWTNFHVLWNPKDAALRDEFPLQYSVDPFLRTKIAEEVKEERKSAESRKKLNPLYWCQRLLRAAA